MSARNPSSEPPAASDPPPGTRVTTIISCPGVLPLARGAGPLQANANENHWFDRIGFRRRWRSNMAAAALTLALLVAGVWIALEFVRLQKVAACYEAGRRNCSGVSLDPRVR